MIQIDIDLQLLNKEDLTLEQYLILVVLYNTDDDIDFQDDSTKDIIKKLNEKGYLRLIEDTIVLDSKSIKLFETDISIKAKEVLDHMNYLKKSLNISKIPFNYRTHGREIRNRISEGVDMELIKKMLTYKYNKWKGTEWQMYLRPATLFNKTKFYNYIEEFDQKGQTLQNSRYTLV